MADRRSDRAEPGVQFQRRLFQHQPHNLISNGVTRETLLDNQAQYGYPSPGVRYNPNFRTSPVRSSTSTSAYQSRRGADTGAGLHHADQAAGHRVRPLHGNLNGTYYIQYDTEQPDGTFLGGVSMFSGPPRAVFHRATSSTRRSPGNTVRGRQRWATSTSARTSTLR
jgi:hypothetical protein